MHPLELIEGVVLVQGRPVQGLLPNPVSVAVVGIAGMGEQGLPGADGEARQVLVQVVGILLPDGAVGHGPGRAVRVIGVGRYYLFHGY